MLYRANKIVDLVNGLPIGVMTCGACVRNALSAILTFDFYNVGMPEVLLLLVNR